ncbi:unnamed protein product [Rhizopus microsporus]
MDEDGIPFIRDEYRSNFEENDFGDDTEQILLIIDSVLENNGHFHSKDYTSRLLGYNSVSIDSRKRAHLKSMCSALVRAPLLGTLKFWDGTSVIENTTNSCRITHSDPRCMISCVIVSILIARLLRGQDLEIKQKPTPIPTLLHSPPLTDYFIDSLTTDQTLQVLVRDVIETNKQVFHSSYCDTFFASKVDQDQMLHYYHQLLACCEPSSLTSLQLDKSTDDVFKSLGAAIYCFTRAIPPQSETEYFKKIIMDVIMQGGEADINATTTGAILGARLGYSQLPTEWVVGMKRWEWLEDRIDEFCALF